ncbi:MAG: dihydrofolate reductase family protein [Propionibacteriaceae bacterium]|nr:dihydrofolate reductase family protein [Propionibacteriaceae bacterium]
MTLPLRFRVLSGPDGLPDTLIHPGRPSVTGETGTLDSAYAWPAEPIVRGNFITTLDGSITGADGLSGSLGNPADKAVFGHLRATCDAIVVGAGTARAEDYGPPPPGTPLVVISRRAAIPDRLVDCVDVILATTEGAGERLDRARGRMGHDRVWVLGQSDVPAAGVRDRLVADGRSRILHEGGPSLITQWLGAGCVDQLCLTIVPRLGDNGPRLTTGQAQPLNLVPEVILQEGATLFTRWVVGRQSAG